MARTWVSPQPPRVFTLPNRRLRSPIWAPTACISPIAFCTWANCSVTRAKLCVICCSTDLASCSFTAPWISVSFFSLPSRSASRACWVSARMPEISWRSAAAAAAVCSAKAWSWAVMAPCMAPIFCSLPSRRVPISARRAVAAAADCSARAARRCSLPSRRVATSARNAAASVPDCARRASTVPAISVRSPAPLSVTARARARSVSARAVRWVAVAASSPRRVCSPSSFNWCSTAAWRCTTTHAASAASAASSAKPAARIVQVAGSMHVPPNPAALCHAGSWR